MVLSLLLLCGSDLLPPLGSKSKGRYGALPLWYAIETAGREDSDLIRLIQLLINLHPQGPLLSSPPLSSLVH
jgi:hypothetical protein